MEESFNLSIKAILARPFKLTFPDCERLLLSNPRVERIVDNRRAASQ